MTKYAVDPFIPHAVLEGFLLARAGNGWRLYRMIECAPGERGLDLVTLVWSKETEADDGD